MYKFHVDSNQQLTPTTLLLTLKRQPSTKPFSFQPGQYTAISFKRNGRPTSARCFSIVNSPTDRDIIQCSIRTKGKFTSAVAGLEKGDEVKVRGSFGAFVFDPARDLDAVLIAGGIGIAPFMSMIQYATATNLSNSITLIYSCSDQNDVPFFKQLRQLEKQNPNLKIVYVISRGPIDKFSGQDVKTGRVTPEIIKQAVNGIYNKKSFFICGPSLFMNAMTRTMRDKDVPDNMIMTEAFSQKNNRQTGKLRSWPNNIYVLGAVGVALTSLVIMIKDLLETLPASNFSASSSLVDSTYPTNSRQTELDNLVNGLPSVANTAPATDAAIKSGQQSNTGTSVTNPTTTTTSAAPTPTPAPKPAPVCTTSQSTGMTTCI